MAFRHAKALHQVETRKYPSTASVTIAVGDLLKLVAAGTCERAASGDANYLGIAAEAKASSDTATTPILVHVIRPGELILADATTTTPTQAHVGEEVDVVDHASVNVGASSNDDVTVAGLYGTATDKVYIRFQSDHLHTGTGII